MRRVPAADEKPLHWVGSAKRDFLSFPAAVKDDMGNALGIAQFGGTAPIAKPWKGLGPGVLEIVESNDGNAYRAVYTVRFEKALYVLHAFQKKSQNRTARPGPCRRATATTEARIGMTKAQSFANVWDALEDSPRGGNVDYAIKRHDRH